MGPLKELPLFCSAVDDVAVPTVSSGSEGTSALLSLLSAKSLSPVLCPLYPAQWSLRQLQRLYLLLTRAQGGLSGISCFRSVCNLSVASVALLLRLHLLFQEFLYP